MSNLCQAANNSVRLNDCFAVSSDVISLSVACRIDKAKALPFVIGL